MKDLAPVTGEDLKACCVSVYGSGLVGVLLGGRLHPGGDDLTRRLADLVGIAGGDRVLDVASGEGGTARLLARERGATVLGVDLSPALVAAARKGAADAGLAGVAFEEGDAERLPVDDESFDVLICECALCTFPDQAAAVAEARRVLRPRGRVGIADVTLERDRLPPELDTPIGHVACVAGARGAHEYATLLVEAGFTDVVMEDQRDVALATMSSIRDGVATLSGALGGLVDVGKALQLVEVAHEAVERGVIGYVLIAATRGDGRRHRLGDRSSTSMSRTG